MDRLARTVCRGHWSAQNGSGGNHARYKFSSRCAEFGLQHGGRDRGFNRSHCTRPGAGGGPKGAAPHTGRTHSTKPIPTTSRHTTSSLTKKNNLQPNKRTFNYPGAPPPPPHPSSLLQTP